MADKKNATMKQKQKTDDAVVLKVMVALVIMCASLMALHSLRKFYSTVGGMDVLDPLTLPIAIAGLALFVIFAVLTACWKNNIARMVLPSVCLFFLMAGFTGLSMRLFWTTGFSSLFFLCVALFVLYVILQLYRWEFFFFSLVTVSAGFAFFTFRTGINWSVWNVMTLVLVAVLLFITLYVTLNAARHNGALMLGKKKVQVFSTKFNPTLLYLACGLWLVGLIAALLLGGLFSYYCVFAAIAVEFIAAVYYTFQLN